MAVVSEEPPVSCIPPELWVFDESLRPSARPPNVGAWKHAKELGYPANYMVRPSAAMWLHFNQVDTVMTQKPQEELFRFLSDVV
jgi:hypothetical protein